MTQLIPTQNFEHIYNLAEKIWYEHYTPIVGEAQIAYMLKKFYSIAALKAQSESGQKFYLIENQSIINGYLAVTPQDDGSLFLNKFYVDGRGKGIGQASFEALIKAFPTVELIRLQVNKKNFKSINFYFKVGFTIEDIAVFDIGEGFVMDDFMMTWKKSKS
jgi:diamine N-acetyltransferase